MKKASEYMVVRELVIHGKTCGTIKIKLLDSLLSALLPSFNEISRDKRRKVNYNIFMDSGNLSKAGIEVRPSDNHVTYDFRSGTILISMHPLNTPRVSVQRGKISTEFQLDEFERGFRNIAEYLERIDIEKLLIQTFETIREWIESDEDMTIEIKKLQKLRAIQKQSVKAFLESELKETSVLRYSIDFKADGFTVLFAPCVKASSVSAKYEDFNQTLAGLGAIINELCEYWEMLLQRAKSKGINIAQAIHNSEYEWTKITR